MINLLTAVILILFAALSRLLPHPMNFAPVTAIALFAGVYLNKKYAFIIPIIALIISDAIIGFYPYVFWIYGTILLIALIGLWLKANVQNAGAVKKVSYIAGTTVVSSLIFFIVTNFGVWTSGMFYEMNWSGLMQCYAMAIPFFRNSLMGDIVYVSAMFGIYELVTRSVKKDSLQQSVIKK